MPSHAEKNQTEIENYYHIIDPEEGCLRMRGLKKKQGVSEYALLASPGSTTICDDTLRIYARGAGLCIKGIRVNDRSLQKWKG